MRASRFSVGLLLLPLLAGGCGQKVATERQETAAVVTTVAAGEDMCSEHGVLEAICTKCHPKLIPVFQAKGDWCAEHGFPMSVCPVHHPERGGRPAVEVAVDEAPASGTKIRFKTLETAREAGLEVVPAVEGPNTAGVAATATIVADASHFAVVNAPAAGVVRRLIADFGSRVSRGSPLALIESAEVGEARSKLQAARARVSVSEAAFKREEELHGKGVAALKEVQAARQELESARSEAAAASASLGMIGTSDGSSGSYVLRAPISGMVTKRQATMGTMVSVNEPLFEIVDPSALWADLDVPEPQAPGVRPGQRVVLRVQGLADREFHGTIVAVAPVVDPQTRTIRARARLLRPDPVLRANMYARAVIQTAPSQTAVLVPRAAVQDAKGVKLVFVRLAEDRYETRRVRVQPGQGDLVVVNAGVRPGELVVTTGSFLLKTETLKESIGAGCCEVEAPKKD